MTGEVTISAWINKNMLCALIYRFLALKRAAYLFWSFPLLVMCGIQMSRKCPLSVQVLHKVPLSLWIRCIFNTMCTIRFLEKITW